MVLTQACNKGYAKSGTGEEWSKGKVQPMAFLYRSLAKNVFIFLKSCKKEKKQERGEGGRKEEREEGCIEKNIQQRLGLISRA